MRGEEGDRRHIRVRDEIPVHWRIEQTGHFGEGIIRNLSVSGILLESRQIFFPGKDTDFIIEPVENTLELSFPLARYVWARPALAGSGYCFFGLEFVSMSLQAVQSIEKRIEDRLIQLSAGLNVDVLGRYFGPSI